MTIGILIAQSILVFLGAITFPLVFIIWRLIHNKDPFDMPTVLIIFIDFILALLLFYVRYVIWFK